MIFKEEHPNAGPSRYLSLSRAILLATLLCPPLSRYSQATEPALPSFPPLQFNLTVPEQFTLSNGIHVLLLEDHDLPLIQVQCLFKAGTQYDPPDKVGLGSLLAQSWSQGGSQSRSPEEIEKLLGRTAAGISFSMDTESASAAMTVRKKDFEEVFGTFIDLLKHPAFRADKVRLSKAQIVEGLRRMNDDAADVSRREFRRFIYGETHPYARVPSPGSIDKIKHQDLLNLHRQIAGPEKFYIAVSGDFSSGEMKQRLENAFRDWARRDISWPEVPPVKNTSEEKKIYFIRKPAKQTQIRIGLLGFKRLSPDEYAWTVFNELWGGGSSSKLFTIVRTQKGLAYGVGSAYSTPADRGIIVAISQTRGGQTISAVQSILDVSRDMEKANVSAKSIEAAKQGLINQFVQNFTTPSQIVAVYMQHAYYGFASDYLKNYTRNIEKVSLSDIQRVGKTYLKTDEATVFLVGDPSTFEKPLSTLGKIQEVKPLDYSQTE